MRDWSSSLPSSLSQDLIASVVRSWLSEQSEGDAKAPDADRHKMAAPLSKRVAERERFELSLGLHL